MTHFPLIILQLLELSVLLKVDIRPQKPEHYRVQLTIILNALKHPDLETLSPDLLVLAESPNINSISFLL